MPASLSVARATATLPRHWSKPIPNHHQALNTTEARMSKRQEAANRTRLILQNYLRTGIEPPPELLDSLDPTNLSYDGTLSSMASIDSIKPILSSASDQRQRLIRKQTRRQSILPSFYEPLDSHSINNPHNNNNTHSNPLPLTTAALTQHDHPALAFLAPPSPVIRRAISFAAAPPPPPPRIRIVKPEPECLDDHSNPSSRDPFYYDKVLDRLDLLPPQPPPRLRPPIHSNTSLPHPPQTGFVDDDRTVTAWFADQYLSTH